MLDKPRSISHTRQIATMLADTYQRVQDGEIGPTRGRALALIAREMLRAAMIDHQCFNAANEAGGSVIVEPLLGDPSSVRLTITQSDNIPLLREKTVALLAEGQSLPANTIARELSATRRQVQLVLDHEWFEKTPQGYRMAETC